MELELAAEMARTELKKWGLEDWSFKFNDRHCSFGLCRYDEKTIFLSKYLVNLNTVERTMQTVLHEIAHALLGPGHGHDNEWKKLCIKIGGNGVRCYTEANTVTPKFLRAYTYVCTSCGRETHKSYILRQPRACGRCCEVHNFGNFSSKFALKLVIK